MRFFESRLERWTHSPVKYMMITAAVTTDITTTTTSSQRLICLLARDSGLLFQGTGNPKDTRGSNVVGFSQSPVRYLRFPHRLIPPLKYCVYQVSYPCNHKDSVPCEGSGEEVHNTPCAKATIIVAGTQNHNSSIST